MKLSEPLFSKILEANKLIKGKLNVSNTDLKKLYADLQQNEEKLKGEQLSHERKIKRQIKKINNIRFNRKRLRESVLKSFYPSKSKISLLYKNQLGTYYIKARFYWAGKQREVQVGSIKNVIVSVNILIDNGMIKNLDSIEKTKISWDEILKKAELKDGIKVIASIKAQEYILRRLLKNSYKKLIIKEELNQKNIVSTSKDISMEKKEEHTIVDDISDTIEGVDWYEKWREKNL